MGSAAYNLLAISAVCVVAIPDGEGRRLVRGTCYNVKTPFKFPEGNIAMKKLDK